MSVAIIAGSGLSELAAAMRVERRTRFADVPGVGAAAVAGHAGEILSGTIAERPCQLVLGRRHVYERDARAIESLIDHLVGHGATTLFVTSAAGSLRRWLRAGDLVVIRDIIDHQNRRGPSGAGTPASTGRGMTLSMVATRAFEAAATAAGVAWQPGTMYCATGPLYETAAEVAFQQHAGADVATMSGAPEVAYANRIALAAVSVAVVTNPCTGIDASVPSHTEVLEAGAQASRGLARAVTQFIAKL